MMDLEFRAARPEDVDQVVALIYASSRALLDYTFRFGSEDARGLLRRDFLGGEGLFGLRNQIVGVTAGGEVLATATFYPGRQVNRLTSRTMLSSLRHFGPARFVAVLGRSLAMAPLFINPRADGLFVANACVAAAHRGQGACTALFEHAFQSTLALGLAVAELDVSFSNDGARRLYERLGFRVVAERPYRGKRALEGFRRMEKPLRER